MFTQLYILLMTQFKFEVNAIYSTWYPSFIVAVGISTSPYLKLVCRCFDRSIAMTYDFKIIYSTELYGHTNTRKTAVDTLTVQNPIAAPLEDEFSCSFVSPP